MVKFTVRITLGNEAMKSANDVARALQKLATQIANGTTNDGRSGKITDVNGNSVGQWSFNDSPV